METETKVRFFLIIGCIILAAMLPSVAIAAFGIGGGIWLCIITISSLPFMMGGKKSNE